MDMEVHTGPSRFSRMEPTARAALSLLISARSDLRSKPGLDASRCARISCIQLAK